MSGDLPHWRSDALLYVGRFAGRDMRQLSSLSGFIRPLRLKQRASCVATLTKRTVQVFFPVLDRFHDSGSAPNRWAIVSRSLMDFAVRVPHVVRPVACRFGTPKAEKENLWRIRFLPGLHADLMECLLRFGPIRAVRSVLLNKKIFKHPLCVNPGDDFFVHKDSIDMGIHILSI